jgi:hypothetical protein
MTPLITALYTKARIGSILLKLIHKPIMVDTAMIK